MLLWVLWLARVAGLHRCNALGRCLHQEVTAARELEVAWERLAVQGSRLCVGHVLRTGGVGCCAATRQTEAAATGGGSVGGGSIKPGARSGRHETSVISDDYLTVAPGPWVRCRGREQEAARAQRRNGPETDGSTSLLFAGVWTKPIRGALQSCREMATWHCLRDAAPASRKQMDLRRA